MKIIKSKNIEYKFNTGTYSRKITTNSEEAQIWFDRGLIWAYGFHWAESIDCFKKSIDMDPNCAMAWWGLAYAIGPSYNRMWNQLDEIELHKVLTECFNASQKALKLSNNSTETEKELIYALTKKHPSKNKPDDFNDWTNNYADYMRKVKNQFPEDPDVNALFADSLISRTPWKLWDLNTGMASEGASTLEAKDALEKAITIVENKDSHPHAGLLHYYIHVMEMSPNPEIALRSGDLLRTLVPDCGHLLHMPTHIDVQCGNYSDVVARNSEAIEADKKRIASYGNKSMLSLFAGSVIHNIHFKLYGAMFLGHYKSSMEAIEQFDELIPESLIRIKSPPMANLYEGYFGLKYHAYIRFGEWEKLIELPPPSDPELFLVTTAIYRYAKSLAYASLNNVSLSIEEKIKFDNALEKIPESRLMFNNRCIDILQVANFMLNGEIEYRKGNFKIAFEYLNKAIETEDSLPYDEPWGWMQPARHALGALLLEQDEIEKAEKVYRADLGFDKSVIRARRHPNNVWSLHGLAECLKRQNKSNELKLIEQSLEFATGRIDIPIKASCY